MIKYMQIYKFLSHHSSEHYLFVLGDEQNGR